MPSYSNSRTFRFAFDLLGKHFFQKLKDKRMRMIFMSAMMTPQYSEDIEDIIVGRKFTDKIWATPKEISKRNVKFQVSCCSSLSRTAQEHVAKVFAQSVDGKVILYTNFKHPIPLPSNHAQSFQELGRMGCGDFDVTRKILPFLYLLVICLDKYARQRSVICIGSPSIEGTG
jgi:hypothetical protein